MAPADPVFQIPQIQPVTGLKSCAYSRFGSVPGRVRETAAKCWDRFNATLSFTTTTADLHQLLRINQCLVEFAQVDASIVSPNPITPERRLDSDVSLDSRLLAFFCASGVVLAATALRSRAVG